MKIEPINITDKLGRTVVNDAFKMQETAEKEDCLGVEKAGLK